MKSVLVLTDYQTVLLWQIKRFGYAPDFGEESDWQVLTAAGLVRPETRELGNGKLKWRERVYVSALQEAQS